MPTFELHAAQRDDWPCLDNLLQFYLHDLSQWLPLPLGPQGLFAMQSMEPYWRAAGTLPWLIRVDGQLVGFVTQDQQLRVAGAQYNLGYLFICRGWRRQGLGRAVVKQLLERYSGPWQVLHLEANRPARLFWSQVLEQLSGQPCLGQPCEADGYPATLYLCPGLPSSSTT